MFYNPETKQVIDDKDLSLMYNTSMSNSIEEFKGWFKVHYDTYPRITNEFQIITENEIQLINGYYTITYNLSCKDLNEIKVDKKYRWLKTIYMTYLSLCFYKKN